MVTFTVARTRRHERVLAATLPRRVRDKKLRGLVADAGFRSPGPATAGGARQAQRQRLAATRQKSTGRRRVSMGAASDATHIRARVVATTGLMATTLTLVS